MYLLGFSLAPVYIYKKYVSVLDTMGFLFPLIQKILETNMLQILLEQRGSMLTVQYTKDNLSRAKARHSYIAYYKIFSFLNFGVHLL